MASITRQRLLLVELPVALVSSARVDLSPVDGILHATGDAREYGRQSGNRQWGMKARRLDEIALRARRGRRPRAPNCRGGAGGIHHEPAGLELDGSSAAVVVCFPLKVQSETSRTLRFRPGWMAFKSEAAYPPALARERRPRPERSARGGDRAPGRRPPDGPPSRQPSWAYRPTTRAGSPGHVVQEPALFQDHDGPDAADLGRGRRQSVDADAELEPGLGQGRDDEDLVDVGGDDLLAIAIAAGDHAATRARPARSSPLGSEEPPGQNQTRSPTVITTLRPSITRFLRSPRTWQG